MRRIRRMCIGNAEATVNKHRGAVLEYTRPLVRSDTSRRGHLHTRNVSVHPCDMLEKGR
jgi:hypothetical protein